MVSVQEGSVIAALTTMASITPQNPDIGIRRLFAPLLRHFTFFSLTNFYQKMK